MSIDEESAPPVAPPVDAKAAKHVRRRMAVVGVVVLAALGFLLFRGLGDATVYFRTADEAIAQRDSLDGKRFRIEGVVVPHSIQQDGANTNFVIASKDTTVQVKNSAPTQGIFREGIPVVMEGRFEKGTDVFISDQIMVKHDSNYSEEHPERITGAANQ